MKNVIVILFTLILLSSCIFPVYTNPKIDKLIELAVDTLEVNNEKYTLDAFVWRDFMPGDIEDHSMYSVTTLTRVDSLAIPSDIQMIEQYVIQNLSIWEAEYLDRIDSLSTFQIRRGSSGGPEWEIGSYVNVISKISDIDTCYYIIKENVEIIMTQ